MDRTERFYVIDRMLHERKCVPRRDFLDALGVSLATFKRDLEYLRDRFHAPIVWNADRQGYEFGVPNRASPAYALPGLWFNQSEIHALLTMQQLLADLQPGLLAQHVAPLRARLECMLQEGEVEPADVHKRIRILRQAARPLPAEIFETIAAATLRRRRLRIRYHARSTDLDSERIVSPQRLVHYRDNWYLDAWCHERNDLRKFAVDAVTAAELKPDKAKAVDLSTLERRPGSGYGIFSGDDIEWAVLRFTPQRARWVAQEQWHPQQRGRFEADGSYRLEVPFADTRELAMDVLKYGAEVEVLGPPRLNALIEHEIGRMAARIRTGAASTQEPQPA